MNLVTKIVVVGAVCLVVIPVLGILLVGPDAGVAVTGVSILLLWPGLTFWWHRSDQG